MKDKKIINETTHHPLDLSVFGEARSLMNVCFYHPVFAGINDSFAAVIAYIRGSHNHLLPYSTYLLFAVLSGVSLPGYATIEADTSAPTQQQPNIEKSANGTTVINIQTPSAAGVSRNSYKKFDVDKKGVILNNSNVQTQTVTGGQITANPKLMHNQASVILNEVNSNNPSQLNGHIEVAGKNSHVIIANPSGISCDGCRFINANRTTLTTGNVLLNDGKISGYHVEKGNIVIKGKGMDSSKQNHTDIIARSVDVNAGLWAKELSVTTGQNIVDSTNETIIKQTNTTTNRPHLAVDISLIGGMYANKIKLIGTENGVGVRNAGNIGTLAGNVVLNVDGLIENKGVIRSQQTLQLHSQKAIINSGMIQSNGDVTISSSGTITNNGTIDTKDSATIQTNSHLANNGNIKAQKNITINAASFESSHDSTITTGTSHSLASPRHVTITVKNEALLHGKIATELIRVNAGKIDISHSRIQANHLQLQTRFDAINTANATFSFPQIEKPNTVPSISSVFNNTIFSEFKQPTPNETLASAGSLAKQAITLIINTIAASKDEIVVDNHDDTILTSLSDYFQLDDLTNNFGDSALDNASQEFLNLKDRLPNARQSVILSKTGGKLITDHPYHQQNQRFSPVNYSFVSPVQHEPPPVLLSSP